MKPQVNIKQIIELISKEYSPLSESCKEDLAGMVQQINVEKNYNIVKEGQYSDKTYFVIQGCLRAYYLKDGKDITDWFAFENDFLNSIISYFYDVPSQHYIEALEPSVLLKFCKDDVLKLADQYPDFDRFLRVAITKTMLQLQQRIVSLKFETASEKYESLISARPDITQRVPLTHIASFLGITLETLSRIRNTRSRI